MPARPWKLQSLHAKADATEPEEEKDCNKAANGHYASLVVEGKVDTCVDCSAQAARS